MYNDHGGGHCWLPISSSYLKTCILSSAGHKERAKKNVIAYLYPSLYGGGGGVDSDDGTGICPEDEYLRRRQWAF